MDAPDRAVRAHVAIVGSGLTGTLVALNLVDRLPGGSRLTLLGTAEGPGRGLAYATPNDAHLLNVPAYRMSVFPDDPKHFVRWLWAGLDTGPDGPDIPPGGYDYLPRRVFGDYVAAVFADAAARNGNRVQVELRNEEVTDCEEQAAHVRLTTATGRTISADAAVLCLGNRPGRLPLAPEMIAPAARSRIVDDPADTGWLEQLDGTQRVLLVGTGLTMLDQVVSLSKRGHAGPITAISRHGLVPHPQVEPRPAPSAPTDLDGEDRLLPIFRAVRRAARRRLGDGGDWRAVIDGLRPITQALWRRLDTTDRRRFLRHLDAFWAVHRHRAAPQMSSVMRAMQDAGQLTVRAGKLDSITISGAAPVAAWRPRGSHSLERMEADWIVNCAGLARSRGPDDLPLLQRMIERGDARPDPMNLGLDVTEDGAVVRRSGSTSRRLHAAGPTTIGAFWEITAVPDIRVQCRALASAIVSYIEASG